MSEENKKLALEEKEKGNVCYKSKNFDSAIAHYEKARNLDPNEATYVSNLSAVYFEMKDFKKCAEICGEAIEIGRENRADFKLIAKMFNRQGNCYRKMEMLPEAKTSFEKALTEHRTPEYRTSLSNVESMIKKREEEAYIDPELAEKEKASGNELFKAGDFGGAIKHYTEAIRRNPKEVKIYSNRAACYTKLLSFDLALKDCEKCLELDPKFIKAYLRKANVLKGMGQTSKAMSAYEKALELDPNCSEAIEGYRNCSIQSHSDPEETRKRAMSDPEVQKILADPAMRMILEQMQNDPNSINEHLKNPAIAEKFMKLREAGLISVAYK